jgi:hypothetical protein
VIGWWVFYAVPLLVSEDKRGIKTNRHIWEWVATATELQTATHLGAITTLHTFKYLIYTTHHSVKSMTAMSSVLNML